MPFYNLPMIVMQVEDLNRKAQLQEVELEQTRKELQEALMIAEEESAKCKAAKEVIKSLTAQVSNCLEVFDKFMVFQRVQHHLLESIWVLVKVGNSRRIVFITLGSL